MAADLHDLAVTVAGRLDIDEPELSGDVPDLMHMFRHEQLRARERYMLDLAREVEHALNQWLRQMEFDEDDVAAFLADLTAAAEADDLQAFKQTIEEWMHTGNALADPDRRAVLTAPVDPSEMQPVDRPS